MNFWHAPHSGQNWMAIVAIVTLLFGGIPVIWKQLKNCLNPLFDIILAGILILIAYYMWMHV